MGIHCKEIHEIFHDKSVGSDLYNADIKVTNVKKRGIISKSNKWDLKYTYYHKDKLVEYLLLWNFNDNCGHVILTKQLKFNFKVKSAIFEEHVKRISIFNCNSLDELKLFYDTYILKNTTINDFIKV